MFGSSTNGFGMRSSDLDLCLKRPRCSEVSRTLLQYRSQEGFFIVKHWFHEKRGPFWYGGGGGGGGD